MGILAEGTNTMDQQQPPSGQPSHQSTEQRAPADVAQTVRVLESLEREAQRAHGLAMQLGDSWTAGMLADLSEIAHLEKTLLLRESEFAGTFGRSTQRALQQSSHQLEQSQIPGVQQVVQLARQASETILQAGQQAAQSGQSGQFAGGSRQVGQGELGESYYD